MRRLLYLLPAILLLAFAVLVCSRITRSGAFVSRTRQMKIREGMPRAEVRRIMTEAPGAKLMPADWPLGDTWEFQGGYSLFVCYAWHGDYHDPQKLNGGNVTHAIMGGPFEKDFLDRTLEFLGYSGTGE